MASPKRAKALVPLEGEILRPLVPGGHRPIDLSTLRGIREEMSWVYRKVHQGALAIELGTRLTYMLDRMAQAIKMGKELELQDRAAAETWLGIVMRGQTEPKPNGGTTNDA